MTPKQTTVLWLGLILVALNFVVNIAEIKSVIFSGPNAKVPFTPAPNQFPVSPCALDPYAVGCTNANPFGPNSPQATPPGIQVA